MLCVEGRLLTRGNVIYGCQKAAEGLQKSTTDCLRRGGGSSVRSRSILKLAGRTGTTKVTVEGKSEERVTSEDRREFVETRGDELPAIEGRTV